jgi:glutaconyl-CoA decarboxylase
MRKFIVNVNGTSYEVEVEEISGVKSAAPVVQAPVAPPAAAPAPAPAAAPAPKAAPVTGGESVNAPMPGNILEVKVKQGDSVKSGDVLLILEAMKMENEILAPKDGVIASVNVSKGSTVNSGDVLCVIG